MTVRASIVLALVLAGVSCHKRVPSAPAPPLIGKWKEVSAESHVLTIRGDGTYELVGSVTDSGNWRTGSNELILHNTEDDAFETSTFLVEGDLLKLWDRKLVMKEWPDSGRPDAAARPFKRSEIVAEINRRKAGRTYTFIRLETLSPTSPNGR